MNQLTIMGRLGFDPDTRLTSSGQKVTTLRVATNQWRGGKAETLWWRATIWGEAFDKMISHLKKGSSVIIAGEMSKPQIYTDREGQPQVTLDMKVHNISFSPFGRGEAQEQNNPSNSQHSDVSAVYQNEQPSQTQTNPTSSSNTANFSQKQDNERNEQAETSLSFGSSPDTNDIAQEQDEQQSLKTQTSPTFDNTLDDDELPF